MDVADWLRPLGLQQYEALLRQNDIDADVLTTLGADDLRELGIHLARASEEAARGDCCSCRSRE